MRALVIGASGQVGSALVAALRGRGHETTATHVRHPVAGAVPLDLADAPAVERMVGEVRPDWIFCPGGLTHVDYCEDHPAEAFAVNLDAALHAARVGARLGARFLYYSSDYVFDGERGPYDEDDPPHPLSVYGRSKLEAERAILGEHPQSLMVRSTWVYGPDLQEKNFVYQVIRNCRSGQGMRVPSDQSSTPTYNADLAGASVELAERGLAGIWHLAGEQVIDRHAFGRLVCEVFGLDPSRLVPVATEALGQKAPRPLKGGLRSGKARAVLRQTLRSAEEGLRAMRAALAGSARGRDIPGGGPG